MAEIAPTVSQLTHALLETKHGLYIAPERKKLASGRESCVYFNIGDEVISYPKVEPLVLAALAQTYSAALTVARLSFGEYQTDRFLGVPEGANMLTGILGYQFNTGQLRVRENMGDHGDQRAIEGYFEPGMTVAVFEDVMSTGGSTLSRAIEPAKAAGLKPTIVITLIDRQYGGIPKMQMSHYIAKVFTTTTEIAQCLISESLVSDAQIRLLQEELEELKSV